MGHLFRNLPVSLRQFRAFPGFAATVVLTLALGIGGTTAIFSVIKAVVLNPLPFRDPQRLVHVWEGFRGGHYHRGDDAYFISVRPGTFYDWRAKRKLYGDVLRLIPGEISRLAFVGSLLGCIAAYIAVHLATNQLYLAPALPSSQAQTQALNPAIFLLCALFSLWRGDFGQLCACKARLACGPDDRNALEEFSREITMFNHLVAERQIVYSH